MSVREIKEKLAALSRREQDEVVAFLFHLRHAEDPEYQGTLAQRLEDKDLSHWLSPDPAADAGGPRRLAIREPWAARAAQFSCSEKMPR